MINISAGIKLAWAAATSGKQDVETTATDAETLWKAYEAYHAADGKTSLWAFVRALLKNKSLAADAMAVSRTAAILGDLAADPSQEANLDALLASLPQQ